MTMQVKRLVHYNMYDSNKHVNNEKLKKRLGQYFTNEKLADLLVVISRVPKNIIAIDPMAGTGNMLVSLIKNGYKRENVFGIEIDPIVGSISQERVGVDNIKIGNAFKKVTYSSINPRDGGWDLVITNPPYVRYQTMKQNTHTELELPTASEIRIDLLATIEQFTHLDLEDRKILKILTQSYSGLSDVAVPSWILCASMVKLGGKLAMVVPNTWLNREYAAIVQYVLLKWFDIEFVIEDINSEWFSDAQVKTDLLVAKRRQRRDCIFEAAESMYTAIKIYSSMYTKKLVPGMSSEDSQINGDLCLKKVFSNIDCSIHNESMNSMVSNVLLHYCNSKWYKEIEGGNIIKSFTPQRLPAEIIKYLKINAKNVKSTTLESLGISVGQGLRTGANKFFYLTLSKKDSHVEHLKTDKHFGNATLKVSRELTRVVVRKQSDLPRQLVIDIGKIEGRVLYIQDAATSRDFKNTNKNTASKYRHLDKELENYILKAETTPIDKKNPDKLIPALSAVKPNMRIDKTSGDAVQRFWYMLPLFVKRHVPDFCVPRVNDTSPGVYMLLDQNVVVDANFSTIWIDDTKNKNKFAYFAVLNSMWFKACLESISTVMGGGALKVEAAHIKKIPLPVLEPSDYMVLNKYGEILSKTNQQDEIQAVIKKIDTVLLQRLFDYESVEEEYSKLELFIRKKINQRKKTYRRC